MTISENNKNTIDKAIDIFNTKKNSDYMFGIHYNYTQLFAECYDEFIESMTYTDFIHYMFRNDFDRFEAFCIFIISIKIYMNIKKKNSNNYYLDIIHIETINNNTEYSKLNNDEGSYVFLKNKKLNMELVNCYQIFNENPDIDISKINITEYDNSGFEKYDEYLLQASKHESFNFISKNKILQTIKNSKFYNILFFEFNKVHLYPFVFNHFSFLKKKENGEFRVMNKINIIGELVSGKLNKLINYKFKNKSTASQTYGKFIKIIEGNDGFENVYQLDIKKAYDNVIHELLIKMMPESVKPIIKLFITSSMNFRSIDNKHIRINRSKGIPIGSILSPMLYELYIENIIDNNIKISINNYVRYVDDFRVLYTGKFEDLQTEFKNNGLELNSKKTKPIDLSDNFLKFPNNIYNYLYLIVNYKSYIKDDLDNEDKWILLLNKFLNVNETEISYFLKTSIFAKKVDSILNSKLDFVDKDSLQKYINVYFNSIMINTYDNKKIFYKQGSTLEYMFNNNNRRYLYLYYSSTSLYHKCNLCYCYNIYNIKCVKNCRICLDCYSSQLIYSKYITCPHCENKITLSSNKQFITKLLSTEKFSYIRKIFDMKKILTAQYNKINEYQTESNIDNITNFIEFNINNNLDSELLNILINYRNLIGVLTEFIEQKLLLNYLSIIHLKCKYCLTINKTTNNKLFKCTCNDIFQCKLCPLIFDKNIDHDCDDDIKLCPDCRIPIKKLGGCNHVKCICGKEFDFKKPLLLIEFDYKPIDILKYNTAYSHLLIYEKILFIILNYKLNSFDKLLNYIFM
jgi:hypothetical protein